MTKGESTWTYQDKGFPLLGKGKDMIYSHFPIQYQTQDKLESWRKASQKEQERMSLPIQISCSGCPHYQLCTSNKPCKDYAFTRYLPRHILTAVIQFNLEAKCWGTITAGKKLWIQFSDGKSVTFSIGLFINGREVTDNLLQVLLRRFPKRFRHFKNCRRKVIRWKFPMKS